MPIFEMLRFQKIRVLFLKNFKLKFCILYLSNKLKLLLLGILSLNLKKYTCIIACKCFFCQTFFRKKDQVGTVADNFTLLLLLIQICLGQNIVCWNIIPKNDFLNLDSLDGINIYICDICIENDDGKYRIIYE